MGQYYIYVIRCEDNSLYTGITVDIVRRMTEHRTQSKAAAKYTRSHKAVELVAAWRAPDRSIASKCEYRLKQLDRDGKDEYVKYPVRIEKLFDEATLLVPCSETELTDYWNLSVEERA